MRAPTKVLTTLAAGSVWIVSMLLLPAVTHAQLPPVLPPFGPIDNGSEEIPPSEPAGGLILNDFGSDVKLDFLNPGPVVMTAELLGLGSAQYRLILELSGTTTAEQFNPAPADPTAEATLFFRTEQLFDESEILGTSGANPWVYEPDGSGVSIELPDNASSSSGVVELLDGLGAFPANSFFDLYEFGLGMLFLGWNDDAFACGVAQQCTPFVGLPGVDQQVSLGQLLPTSPDRNPTDVDFDFPLCWAISDAGPGNSTDPRNFTSNDCLVTVNGVQRNQLGAVNAAGIVPEPTTLALLVLGLGGLAARRRSVRR